MAHSMPSTTSTNLAPKLDYPSFVEFELAPVKQKTEYTVHNHDMCPVYIKFSSSNPKLVTVPPKCIKLETRQKMHVPFYFKGVKSFDDIPSKINIKMIQGYTDEFVPELTKKFSIDVVFSCPALSGSPDKIKKK